MRRVLLVAGLLALAAQCVAVYTPSAPDEQGVPYLDKVVHLAVFAAPTALLLLAGLRAALVLTLLAVHGPVSEGIQAGVLPHRDGSWDDALADLTGVLVGGLAAYAVVRGRRRADLVGEPAASGGAAR
jgi:VanZ family protein